MGQQNVSHNQILIAFLFVIWRWAAAMQHALAHQMTILWQCRSVTSINHLVVPYRVLFVFADEFTSPRHFSGPLVARCIYCSTVPFPSALFQMCAFSSSLSGVRMDLHWEGHM